MASPKRIGFFWGEEKITVVEFEKNTPHQVVSSPLGSKAASPSPFSSSLTEEIQITAILQRMLQDNNIIGGSFYVSLPMKEIVLRSFIIPFVKPEDVQNVIKFEAKKYMPFDIQDLSFVFYAVPFMEDHTKRLQIIFFAVRKEILARYERVFKQVNAQVSYCEPYMVSLTKALLFKKEIKPTDHLAFLVLDKSLGRICFIDQGIPQFIREFPLASSTGTEESVESVETLNLKIVNEVGNSFDFYSRQFTGDRIEQMLVSSEFIQQDLMKSLETELKVKLRKFSPILTAGLSGQNNDMDAIYAMGACVTPPIESLSGFNFLASKAPKSALENTLTGILKSFKDIILLFLLGFFSLVGSYFYFQAHLKVTQQQYEQLSAQQQDFFNVPIDNIQAETLKNVKLLNAYKNVRTKSEMVFILLRVASHLPQGALLSELNVNYSQNNRKKNALVTIEMRGDVITGDPNGQIAMINRIFLDLKNDRELANYIKNVNLVSLNREGNDSKQVTGFTINCS